MRDAVQEWETFFAANHPPQDYASIATALTDFCNLHLSSSTPTVLVTSGGTTVPLEHNTVRFVDNFSAGTRGSCSAEHFLRKGYAVLFLHRRGSLMPFGRHIGGLNALKSLELKGDSICVRPDYAPKVKDILREYHQYCSGNDSMFMAQPFTTLSDYLWLLRAASEAVAPYGSKAVLYLAAAVSDFYIPPQRMPEHKMHSDEGAPTIRLELVPKMLRPLTAIWAAKAYVVSFKLETDESLVISKARAALEKYHHQLVVANILQTRARRVVLVGPDAETPIELTPQQQSAKTEIEQLIVEEIVLRHKKFIHSQQ